jgi:hypothetical protein
MCGDGAERNGISWEVVRCAPSVLQATRSIPQPTVAKRCSPAAENLLDRPPQSDKMCSVAAAERATLRSGNPRRCPPLWRDADAQSPFRS